MDEMGWVQDPAGRGKRRGAKKAMIEPKKWCLFSETREKVVRRSYMYMCGLLEWEDHEQK